jgi:flagellar motility protein MotE (MotC chaperone)
MQATKQSHFFHNTKGTRHEIASQHENGNLREGVEMNTSAPIRNIRASRRKMVLLMLVCLLFKAALAGYYLVTNGWLSNFSFLTQAVAQEEMVESTAEGIAEDATEKTGEPGSDENDFAALSLLQQKEIELERKGAALKEEEERIHQLKTDIEERLAELAQAEKKIEQLIPIKESETEKELIKLAKVFEATPPEQAGPMFNKLDVDLAAKILVKMKGRNAGKIWGYVNPEQAVKISKELANLK